LLLMTTFGLLLAAGEGSRAGGPKALRVGDDGTTWLERAIRVLFDGGCVEVFVVAGHSADQVARIARDAGAESVVASDWGEGLSASLRAGLRALLSANAETAVVHLVDLPDVGAAVVERLVEWAAPDSLARAGYAGRPGHPVLIGREHWAEIAERVDGDTGAKHYLDEHGVVTIDCSDLASGEDVDT